MKKILCLMLVAVIFVLSGCSAISRQESTQTRYQSYKEIPGVTQAEIDMVEAIKAQRPSFIYGMITTTETFYQEDGSVGGFTAMLCQRLSELFGIVFNPQIYVWETLLEKIESNEVDFLGEFTPNPERLKEYYMTDPIAQRSYKIFTNRNAEKLEDIAKERPIKCAFLEGSAAYQNAASTWELPFEPVFIGDSSNLPDMLMKGEVDAIIEEGVLGALFDAHDAIISENYYPLTYSPVSLATNNPELEPIIGIVEKYLKNGGFYELTELYNQGYKGYLQHKLSMHLTDEEKDYILRHNEDATAIALACETSNYPSSFYNAKEKEFQGIAIDILNQVSALTGLKFNPRNTPDAAWSELLEGLENGKYSIVTALFKTANRENRFLWVQEPYCMDNYAMLSHADQPDVDINQILFTKVGLIEDIAYTDVFLEWFPNSKNTVTFKSNEEAFTALEKDEIDLLMASQNLLLHFTNYLEKPGFKTNVVFDYATGSFFGLNKDEEILCSIIDKVQRYVDTEGIAASWQRKVFDYESKMLKDTMPYATGFSIVLLLALFVVFILFLKNKRISKNLEKTVTERTGELERRTTELAIQTATLETMFASIPDIIFCKDLNSCFTRCNKQFEKHFGVTEEEIIGKSDESALGFSPDTAEAFRESDRAVIRGETAVAVEEIIPSVDGDLPVFETVKIPLTQDGKSVGIMGISRNITQRKAAEETLKLTLDNLNTCIYISEVETGKILFMNKRMTEVFDCNDFNGKTCWEVLQNGAKERCGFCPIPKLQESGDNFYIWDDQNPVTEKNYKIMDCLIRWHDGRLVHMQHLVDITDSVRMKDELEEAILKLEMVVKNYDGVIWSVDKDRTITLFDGLYLEQIGVTPSFLEGKSIDLAKQKSRHLDIIEMVEKTFESGPQDCISEIGDGIYKSHTTPVKDKDGNVIGIVGDTVEVTEMIRLQTELKEATEIAENASRAKGDFLSRMSHEIRTPLNAIIGMNGIAMNNDDPAKIHDCLRKVDNASKHLLGIINDILDMSKIEANKFELSFDDFDFERLLMNTTNVINFRAEEKMQNLVVNIAGDIPPLISGDELRLAQVITNLLSNAVKFTQERGTVLLNAKKIAHEDGEVTLQIDVTDTGIGISEEQQSRLFTSFEQADGGIARKFGGTGLGLAISKRIVELMGGRIWIESEIGKGSTFSFTIRAKTCGERKRTLLSASINRENVRILAVDDSEETRLCFAHIMDAHGLPYDLAASGDEALGKVKNCGDKPYNVFFIDWQMQDMDGIELTKKVKQITADNSVVFMISVTDWTNIEKEALSAGVRRFVPKPLFPSLLIDAINECFGVGAVKDAPVKRPRENRCDFRDYAILIAEDVEINQEIMSAVLEETGVSIDFADNGQKAVSMFQENPGKYSLILMDIHMPEMDGYKATRAIRALESDHAQNVPILAMTANVFKEDIENCLAAGMNDHVGKPVDANDLLNKMGKYIMREAEQ